MSSLDEIDQNDLPESILDQYMNKKRTEFLLTIFPSESIMDLSGNFLNEVPMHQFFTSLTLQHRWINASLSYQYISTQWYDEANTILLEPYSLVDLKLYRTFWNKLKLTLMIQNLLGDVYIDRKGLLSPGRFITGELSFIF